MAKLSTRAVPVKHAHTCSLQLIHQGYWQLITKPMLLDFPSPQLLVFIHAWKVGKVQWEVLQSWKVTASWYILIN